MKRLLIATIIIAMFAIFLIGCAEKAPLHPVEQEKLIKEKQAEQPKIREIDQPKDNQPVEEQTTEDTDKNETIGNRLNPETSEPEVVDVKVPEQTEMILIYPNKTISSGNKTIEVGDTLSWKNTDTWPHHLVVFTGTDIYTSKKWGESRLEAGDTWNYTFKEPGTYLIKDMFSGGVRMYAMVK